MKKQFFKRLTALAIIVAIVTGLVQDVHIARAEESTQAISNDLTATSTTPDTTQTVSTESSSEIKPTVLCELTDKREASVKRFLMSDNTVQAVVYSQPVHYKENGEWKDIDNTLSMESAQDSEDINGYTNTHADFKVKIADNSSAKYLAKIQKGKYKIEFGLADQSKNISTYNNAIINKKEFGLHFLSESKKR